MWTSGTPGVRYANNRGYITGSSKSYQYNSETRITSTITSELTSSYLNLKLYNTLNSSTYDYVRNINIVFAFYAYICCEQSGGNSPVTHQFNYSNERIAYLSTPYGTIEMYATGSASRGWSPGSGGFTVTNFSNINLYFTSNYTRLSTLQPASSIPDGGHYGKFLIRSYSTNGNSYRVHIGYPGTFNWINSGVLFNR